MAWTAPRTWVAAETVTAALLNTHLRDNLKALGDAWTAYTPTWTASTTNPAIGNGTLAGAYLATGKFIAFRLSITMGSTTTYGSGTWRISLPTAVVSMMWRWNGMALDSSSGFGYRCDALWVAANTAADITRDPTTAGNPLGGVTATLPFTWASGDTYVAHGVYEAA